MRTAEALDAIEVATKLSAVTGPMLGVVMSRRTTGSFSACWASRASAASISWLRTSIAARSGAISVANGSGRVSSDRWRRKERAMPVRIRSPSRRSRARIRLM